MAEAPTPQGQSGATGTAPDADGGADEPKYTEAAHQAAIKERVRNLKKANAAYEARIKDLESKIAAQGRAVDDDDDLDEAPAPTAAAQPTQPSTPQVPGRPDRNVVKLQKANAALAERERALAADKAKIEAELKATTLRVQAKEAIAKWASDNGAQVRDVDEVLALTLGEMKLDETGATVRTDKDGDEIALDTFYADFFKRKPHHVTAPPAGTGTSAPGGRAKRAPLEGRQGLDLLSQGLQERFGNASK